MTKEEWIDMKKKGEYSIDAFWELFQDKNKEKEMTKEEFEGNFQKYINFNGKVPLQNLTEYFDNKFSIVKIFKDGKQIA